MTSSTILSVDCTLCLLLAAKQKLSVTHKTYRTQTKTTLRAPAQSTPKPPVYKLKYKNVITRIYDTRIYAGTNVYGVTPIL
jgi:hypothetical protein